MIATVGRVWTKAEFEAEFGRSRIQPAEATVELDADQVEKDSYWLRVAASMAMCHWPEDDEESEPIGVGWLTWDPTTHEEPATNSESAPDVPWVSTGIEPGATADDDDWCCGDGCSAILHAIAEGHWSPKCSIDY